MVLKQASIAQVKHAALERDNAHIVITMRFYPRFLKKELRDDFQCELAPPKELLHDFNEAQTKLKDHNLAFDESEYEQRFDLSAKGVGLLQSYSQMSKEKDVYFVCICEIGQMCHREILLLMAKRLYRVEIGEVFNSYPTIMGRLESGKMRGAKLNC
ncbi:MAG TPA: DUF488 family protein [Candidatus Obscuribacterales bacterium]